MKRPVLIAFGAGLLFGLGLVTSHMVDPACVRGFLDVAGHWDPTLLFFWIGALTPMMVAWRVQRRMLRPLAAAAFNGPGRGKLDTRLFAGAALFGVGWGAAGLCPGPALTSLAVAPGRAALFVAGMLAGMALHRLAIPARTPAPSGCKSVAGPTS